MASSSTTTTTTTAPGVKFRIRDKRVKGSVPISSPLPPECFVRGIPATISAYEVADAILHTINTNRHEPIRLLVKFPNPINLLDFTTKDISLQMLGLTDKEVVVVEDAPQHTSQQQSPAKTRPKRAAAVAATAANRKRSAVMTKNDSSDDDDSDNYPLPRRTGNTTTTRQKSPTRPKKHVWGKGQKAHHEDNDDDNDNISREDRMGALLASSMAPGGGRGTERQAFRRYAKAEVRNMYEVTKANARLTSALAHTCEITRGQGTDDRDKLVVKFKKGPRTMVTETVDYANADTLKAIIRSVMEDEDYDTTKPHPREGLRAREMSLISPRTFWSLLFLNGHNGGDTEAIMQQLLPELDWSFLKKRRRAPSAKAIGAGGAAATNDVIELDDDDDSADMGGEPEPDDDLNLAIPDEADRRAIRAAGITSLDRLAEENTEHGEMARVFLCNDWMEQCVVMQGPTLLAALRALDFKTPADIVALRVPGRTEFVARELNVSEEVVNDWRLRAAVVVGSRPWLSNMRTRG